MKHALLLLSFIATQAHAQIVYTDVDPDASYSAANDTCSLDLDNDGKVDYLIVQRTEDPYYCLGCLNPHCQRPIHVSRSWVTITTRDQ